MMENFNFTIYITRFVVVSKQLRVSSMLFTLEITEAGSALLVSHPHSSQLVLMLIIFIFISTFFCVSKNFKNTILFFSYILSKPKSVLFQSTTVFRGAPHGCANSKTSEERGHEQRTTHGRLELWRIYMTTLHYYYTKTIDVGRKSFSHLMWVHQWISFTRISGFSSLFIRPFNNINNCDIFYVKTKFLLYIFWRRIGGALTFLVKSTGYLSKSTSPMISGWVRRESPFY